MSEMNRTTGPSARWISVLALAIGLGLLTSAFLDWIALGSLLYIGACP
jgi:hypothetical protein